MSILDRDEVERRLDEHIGDIRSDTPQARKRRRILEAAARLFSTQGYRKTNVDEIANTAGVAKGTFYLYFKTKAEVLIAAVAVEKKEYIASFASVFDPSVPAKERLRKWITAALTIASRAPIGSRLLQGDNELEAVLADAPPELVARSRADSDEAISELIRAAIAPATLDPQTLRDRTRTLVGIMSLGPKLFTSPAQLRLSPESFAESLAAMLLDGLTAPPGTP